LSGLAWYLAVEVSALFLTICIIIWVWRHPIEGSAS
jgi:hypothetical protein